MPRGRVSLEDHALMVFTNFVHLLIRIGWRLIPTHLGFRTIPNTWHACFGHPSCLTSIMIFALSVSRIVYHLQKLLLCRDIHYIIYIYADLWDPVHASDDGSQYYLLLVDHFTKYCWLFPMSAKSQLASLFVQFHLLVDRQFHRQITNVYSDNGGEFVALRSHFTYNGIS